MASSSDGPASSASPPSPASAASSLLPAEPDWSLIDASSAEWSSALAALDELAGRASAEQAELAGAHGELRSKHDATEACVDQMSSQLKDLGDEVARSEQNRRKGDLLRAEVEGRAKDLEEQVAAALADLEATRAENAKLKDDLGDSMPSSHVQELLQAAEKRVAEVNGLVRSSEKRLEDTAKRAEAASRKEADVRNQLVEREHEVIELRKQFSRVAEGLEKRLLAEQRGRSDAEARLREAVEDKEDAEAKAVRATRLAEKMEKRILTLEAETAKLREMMKAATESMGLMDTINKIRKTELPHEASGGGGGGGGGSGSSSGGDPGGGGGGGLVGRRRSLGGGVGGGGGGAAGPRESRIGFDAVAGRVEDVAREVDRITATGGGGAWQGRPSRKGAGGGSSSGVGGGSSGGNHSARGRQPRRPQPGKARDGSNPHSAR
eukprot:g3395.t1